MKKINITKKQSDIINTLLKKTSREEVLNNHAQTAYEWNGSTNVLNFLSFDEMARILYEQNSYNILPNLESGDIIASTNNGELFKIISINPESKYINSDKGFIQKDAIRIATKEEKWFFERNRKLWEIRKNDILKPKKSGSIVEVNSVAENGKSMRFNGYNGFYTLENIRKNYSIISFSENREDNKHG